MTAWMSSAGVGSWLELEGGQPAALLYFYTRIGNFKIHMISLDET